MRHLSTTKLKLFSLPNPILSVTLKESDSNKKGLRMTSKEKARGSDPPGQSKDDYQQTVTMKNKQTIGDHYV